MTDGQVGAPSDKLLEIALGEFKGNYMATLGYLYGNYMATLG